MRVCRSALQAQIRQRNCDRPYEPVGEQTPVAEFNRDRAAAPEKVFFTRESNTTVPRRIDAAPARHRCLHLRGRGVANRNLGVRAHGPPREAHVLQILGRNKSHQKLSVRHRN